MGCLPKPKISISGVEDGKIYVTEQTISIDQNLAGDDYTLKLNGESITNKHTVTDNGHYDLEVTAKKWWQEEEKSIQFEIDDVPPKKPELKANIRSSYFKSVTFGLEREKDVSYEIKLDGKRHDIDSPITKEGDHYLNIVATKDNQLVSQRKFRFEIDNRTYSRNEVDSFEWLSLNLIHKESNLPRIQKWTEDVDVVVHGEPTSQDWKSLNTYISTLNETLPFYLNLHKKDDRTYNAGTIIMHFVPNYRFDELGFQQPLRQGDGEIVGFAYPNKVTYNGVFKEATIGIDTTIPQHTRNTTIYHELIHALGLYKHFDNNRSSILYPYNDTGVTKLAKIDKKMIELLYRPDITPGMYKPQVEATLKPRIID